MISCYGPFSMVAVSAAQLKLAEGAPSITTLLGLAEVITQLENFKLLKVQSEPFFSATAISNGAPLRASSVKSATVVPMARTVIVKVNVNGWRTKPTLSASRLWITVCGVLKVGVKLSMGVMGLPPTVTTSRVFQSGIDLLLIKLQIDCETVYCGGILYCNG